MPEEGFLDFWDEVCIGSCDVLHSKKSFDVHQTTHLPSDHAPISSELQLPNISLNGLFHRACMLGGHGLLMEQQQRGRLASRSVRFGAINPLM